MKTDDSEQQQPDTPLDPKSEPGRTGSFGFQSGEPLSEIFGLDPAGPETDPLLNAEIGGVKIIRLIAQGGMGRVYEGLQQKPSRTVAVKVMRPGLATPGMMKRFEHEVEILARLQHPGIAQIFTAGVHYVAGAPVPYFIMEYVADAKPLTTYADDLKLSTRARLDLFRSVCDAVAHGHERGVIHRDLKPTNILVDAAGVPKVIDFGVAKATDSDLALTTMQTDVGQLIGTLQYMGPEQLAGAPHEIDVRCDVYALGVVLYELLAGKLPYDIRLKAIIEAARVIQKERPQPLAVAARSVHSEIGAIADKCLEKDRARRYASARELQDDIDRHLAGEPIAARSLAWTPILKSRLDRTLVVRFAMLALGIVLALRSYAFWPSKPWDEAAFFIRDVKLSSLNDKTRPSKFTEEELRTMLRDRQEDLRAMERYPVDTLVASLLFMLGLNCMVFALVHQRQWRAVALAATLGGAGLHWFYLHRPIRGSVYLLFSWTLLPAVVALVEGILMVVAPKRFEKLFSFPFASPWADARAELQIYKHAISQGLGGRSQTCAS